MKINKQQIRKGFTLVELLVVVAIIAVLAGLATPATLGALKRANAAEATSNSKQIWQYLIQFDQDMGRFPDDATATLLAPLNDKAYTLTGNSNNYYKQLLVSVGDSEKIFYAKGSAQSLVKPDGDITNNSECLKAGECGFDYVLREAGIGFGAGSNSATIIAGAPTSTTAGQYTEDYGNKAILLAIDGSAGQYNLVDGIPQTTGGKEVYATATGIYAANPVIISPE